MPATKGSVAIILGVPHVDPVGWLLGAVQGTTLYVAQPTWMVGELKRERAWWTLTVNRTDPPPHAVETVQRAWRGFRLGGEEFRISGAFTDLRALVYEEAIVERGRGIEGTRRTFGLRSKFRVANVAPPPIGESHLFGYRGPRRGTARTSPAAPILAHWSATAQPSGTTCRSATTPSWGTAYSTARAWPSRTCALRVLAHHARRVTRAPRLHWRLRRGELDDRLRCDRRGLVLHHGARRRGE